MIHRFGQRRAEPGEVRAPVRIGNRIREGKDLVVVAVVILQDDVDEDFVALAREHDWFRMYDLFVFAELFYEFLDAVLVEKRFLLGRIAALIRERDLQAGV